MDGNSYLALQKIPHGLKMGCEVPYPLQWQIRQIDLQACAEKQRVRHGLVLLHDIWDFFYLVRGAASSSQPPKTSSIYSSKPKLSIVPQCRDARRRLRAYCACRTYIPTSEPFAYCPSECSLCSQWSTWLTLCWLCLDIDQAAIYEHIQSHQQASSTSAFVQCAGAAKCRSRDYAYLERFWRRWLRL